MIRSVATRFKPGLSRRTGFTMLLLTVLVLFAGPAQANPLSDTVTCRQSPDPDTPDGGMAGIVISTPDNPPGDDVNPFEAGSPVSVYDKYGFGGLQWPVYDQGCVGNGLAYPMNTVANFLMKVPVFFTALTEQVADQVAHPTFLGVFDPLLVNTANQVNDGVFSALLPLTLFGAAILVLVSFRNGLVSGAVRAAGWILVIFVLSILFLSQPLTSVHFMDDMFTGVTQTIDDAFGNGQSQVGAIHRQVLYTSWARGMFGNADSATAKEYGPKVFDTVVYSWSEQKRIDADPSAAGAIKEDKQKRFADLADEISKKDPIAYEHLTGVHTDNRMWSAVFADFGALGAIFFKLLAGISIIIARLAIRWFVMVWPLIAILAVIPGQRRHVAHLWERLSGLVISAVALWFISYLVGLLVGAVLSTTGLPGWLVVMLVGAIVVTAWKFARPHHNSHSLIRQGMRLLALTEAVNIGTRHGVEDANTKPHGQDWRPIVDRSPRDAGSPTRDAARANTGQVPDGWVAPPPSPGIDAGGFMPDLDRPGLGSGPHAEPVRTHARVRARRDAIVMVPDDQGVYRPAAEPQGLPPMGRTGKDRTAADDRFGESRLSNPFRHEE